MVVPDPCHYVQCPVTDAAAAALAAADVGAPSAGTTVITLQSCLSPGGVGFVTHASYGGTAAAPVLPPPPPDVVAAAVRNSMTLPPPATTSPDLPNNVDKQIGLPVTYVNLWLWFWSDNATWTPASQSTTLRGTSVLVTATPKQLTYNPGNGDTPINCQSPGRPWTDADANLDPGTIDGCGYRYTTVIPAGQVNTTDPQHPGPDGTVTGTLSITWTVTWTSTINGAPGPTGTLDPLYSTAYTDPFAVEQIQVVTK